MPNETFKYQEEPDSELEAVGRIEQGILDHFQESGSTIDRVAWRHLVTEVVFSELNESVISEDPDQDKRFAWMKKTGELELDSVEFSKLGSLQKRHVLLHEAAHRLDWHLEGQKFEEHLETNQLIEQMGPDRITPYTAELSQKYSELPATERSAMLRQEGMAELMAQYWESDGSFRSFIEVRNWPLDPARGEPTDNIEAGWAGIPEADRLMARLERFEDMSEDEQIALFDEQPRLAAEFHLFFNLRSVMVDPDLGLRIAEENWDDWDGDIYDDLELVSTMPPEVPKIPSAPVKKTLPPEKAGYDPFWLFRSNSPNNS